MDPCRYVGFVCHFLNFVVCAPQRKVIITTMFLLFVSQSAVMVKEQVEDDPALTQVLTQSNQSPPAGGGNNYHNHSAASHSTHLSQHSSHHNSQRSLHSLSQPPHTHEQELEQEQILTWGAMFGDVALVTNRNYFTTTTARGALFLLSCHVFLDVRISHFFHFHRYV